MSKQIKPISWQKLANFFERKGWSLDRISGDHLVYVNDGFVRPIVIPKYKEIPVFIILNNLKTANISKKEYITQINKK